MKGNREKRPQTDKGNLATVLYVRIKIAIKIVQLPGFLVKVA
jgi:hypothetical protein